MPEEMVQFSDKALDLLVDSYTNISDVRELERCVRRLLAHFLLVKELRGTGSMEYTPEEVERVLGPAKLVKRTLAAAPGLAFSACLYMGGAEVFPVEAKVSSGVGRFLVINTNGCLVNQCRAAYECLRSKMPEVDFSALDVTVLLPDFSPGDKENYVGVAAYAAMVSAICDDVGYVKDKAFLGSCDLFGNICMDTNDSDALIRALAHAGLTTVYAPLGMSSRLRCVEDCSVTAIEGEDVHTLVSMAYDLRKGRTLG